VGRPPVREGKLALWIRNANLSRAEVARRLDVSRNYLDGLCREEKRPGRDLSYKIEQLTSGGVPVSYWVSLAPSSKS
jgi:transcriptional regulator with XRE-family HTH domain